MFPGYHPAPHHRALAEALEMVERGELTRLIVTMPPRHGKSELVSVRFPAWYLGRNPDRRIIGCSYAARLAERFSGLARNQFADSRWPYAVELAGDAHARATWDIAGRRGGYIAAGVGGPITGQGAHVLIIDDPIKNAEEADSEVYRDNVWDWYTSTAYTRLEEQDSAVILVLTRWHEDDLAGRLLAEAEQGGEIWTVLNLPAIAEEDDALEREVGEPLWPAKFDAPRLATIRRTLGERQWLALYQQRPTAAEGAMFKRHWFSVVEPETVPDGLRWGRYWDLAVSTKESGDYTASVECAFDDITGALYIRDGIRDRWEWPDARKAIIQTMLIAPATVHLIEEALHGTAALQELWREPLVRHVPFHGVRVTKDKVTRAQSWAARAEAGLVRLVKGPWIADFLNEVCSFPLGAHDDYVDSVSGTVEHLPTVPRKQGPKPGEGMPVSFRSRQRDAKYVPGWDVSGRAKAGQWR